MDFINWLFESRPPTVPELDEACEALVAVMEFDPVQMAVVLAADPPMVDDGHLADAIHYIVDWIELFQHTYLGLQAHVVRNKSD